MNRNCVIVRALMDSLRKMRLRPPAQIEFRQIRRAPDLASFSKEELLNALYTLEYEGVVAIHDNDNFSLLKSPALV